MEVEPGIKIHVLEVGWGYPVYLQHGNPTTGLLYRKVAASLLLDRVRVIMPTMVGLGYSTKVPASEHTSRKLLLVALHTGLNTVEARITLTSVAKRKA